MGRDFSRLPKNYLRCSLDIKPATRVNTGGNVFSAERLCNSRAGHHVFGELQARPEAGSSGRCDGENLAGLAQSAG